MKIGLHPKSTVGNRNSLLMLQNTVSSSLKILLKRLVCIILLYTHKLRTKMLNPMKYSVHIAFSFGKKFVWENQEEFGLRRIAIPLKLLIMFGLIA
ncbi:hypothetical protein AVEN_147536-1, partial [Araneus ventricosus]